MGLLKIGIDQCVVRCEEKEARLRAFVDAYLGHLTETAEPAPEALRASLIARSPASPVARALGELAEDLCLADVALRIVFAYPEPHEQLDPWLDPALTELAESNSGLEIRWPRTPALIEAHEQLVLGANMCWSGDTMRRDPEKRDALELFESGNEDDARLGARAFEAIWSLSKPLVVRRYGAGAASAKVLADAGGATGSANAVPSAHYPSGGTRH